METEKSQHVGLQKARGRRSRSGGHKRDRAPRQKICRPFRGQNRRKTMDRRRPYQLWQREDKQEGGPECPKKQGIESENVIGKRRDREGTATSLPLGKRGNYRRTRAYLLQREWKKKEKRAYVTTGGGKRKSGDDACKGNFPLPYTNGKGQGGKRDRTLRGGSAKKRKASSQNSRYGHRILRRKKNV